MEPIDRTSRDVFGHALDLVVEGPAVPAVQVALVFEEKVRGNRVKLARQNAQRKHCEPYTPR